MPILENKALTGEQLEFSQFNPDEILGAQSASWDGAVIDLRGYFQIKTYPKKSTIYSTGDSLKEVHILKQGRVRLSRPLQPQKPHGEHVVTEILPAGDLFGNMTFEQEHVADETASAAEDCEVWSIGAQELSSLLTARPEMAIEFLKIQSQRLRQQARRKYWLTTKDVPARLAATLLELAELFGTELSMKAEVQLSGITQQDLADLVGASRSFVSTLINLMKQDGYLFSIGRSLYIPSRENLERLAGEGHDSLSAPSSKARLDVGSTPSTCDPFFIAKSAWRS